MKKKIYNYGGPFPSWRWETPEETLVREMSHMGAKDKEGNVVGAANLFIALNERKNGK